MPLRGSHGPAPSPKSRAGVTPPPVFGVLDFWRYNGARSPTEYDHLTQNSPEGKRAALHLSSDFLYTLACYLCLHPVGSLAIYNSRKPANRRSLTTTRTPTTKCGQPVSSWERTSRLLLLGFGSYGARVARQGRRCTGAGPSAGCGIEGLADAGASSGRTCAGASRRSGTGPAGAAGGLAAAGSGHRAISVSGKVTGPVARF